MYAVFVAYPMLLGRRAGRDRDPYLAAVLASAMFFFARARRARLPAATAGRSASCRSAQARILALLLSQLLRIEPAGRARSRPAGAGRRRGAGVRDRGHPAAAAAPVDHDRLGARGRGAGLALSPHPAPRPVLLPASALLAAVFVRLALNPAILFYEPRGAMRIFNWYLYAYVICAAAMFAGRPGGCRRPNDRW